MGQLHKAVVHDRGPALRVDHHVLRLDVAVINPLLVGSFESIGDLAGDAESFVELQGAPRDSLVQRLARDERHRGRGRIPPLRATT